MVQRIPRGVGSWSSPRWPDTSTKSAFDVMVTHFRGVGIFEFGGVLTRKREGSWCRIDIHPSSAAKS